MNSFRIAAAAFVGMCLLGWWGTGLIAAPFPAPLAQKIFVPANSFVGVELQIKKVVVSPRAMPLVRKVTYEELVAGGYPGFSGILLYKGNRNFEYWLTDNNGLYLLCEMQLPGFGSDAFQVGSVSYADGTVTFQPARDGALIVFVTVLMLLLGAVFYFSTYIALDEVRYRHPA
jgi:hypothetical protein